MNVYTSILKSLIIACLFGISFGFDIPNYEGYVTDTVGIFSQTEKSDLISKIEEIEKATGIEIAVLVVSTVDDDINLAAVDVGNKRGVGKEGQNNGLLVLIAVNDRKRSIQVGYGLEGILPDITVKKIGEDNFPPNFREGKYYQGVSSMLDDVLGYISQDPAIVQKYTQSSSNSSDDDAWGFAFVIFFFLLGGFGRRVTIPKTKGTGRKMKKYGWLMYVTSGFVLSLLIAWIVSSIIAAFFISYLFLLLSVAIALAGLPRGGKGIWFGGGSGGSRGGGSSFGGFGGGSFGGGGSSGSR